MSLFQRRVASIATADQLIPSRLGSTRRGSVTVNNETALRHSAVWACLRLRANLVSTMPVDLYRKVGNQQVELSKPPVLLNPGGERVGMGEWMYSTQFDLDRAGNCFGLITSRDARGFPAVIELVSLGDVTVKCKNGVVTYKIGSETYKSDDVWHEKQYTVAGLHVGLSPVAYAAWSIGEYLSIQEFALDWFGNSTMPAQHIKNTAMTLDPVQSEIVKDRYTASVSNGAPWVTGSDWEITPLNAANSASQWLEGKQYGISDIARFFDVPGDLIDAAVAGGTITYANVTQRNLQFLILNLQPAVTRRENALSTLTPRPQFVKLNTDALLRMDPQTREAVIKMRIDARTLAPSEARALDNLPPFTETQLAEFDRLFATSAPDTMGAPSL